MENKKLKKQLYAFVIGLNVIILLTLFLPMFYCSSGDLTSTTLNILGIQLFEGLLTGKIADVQVIVFVVIYLVLLIQAIVMMVYSIKKMRDRAPRGVNYVVLSVFMLIVSIIIYIFMTVLSAQPDLTILLGQNTTDTFTAGFAPYLFLVASLLMIIITKIAKKRNM